MMGKTLLTLILSATAWQPQAEVEVDARLSRTDAQVGETVMLTVTLRAPGLSSPTIDDPELEGFEVLSAIDRSTFRFSSSLGAVREFSREYTLRVLVTGELTIPPIRAEVDGQIYETRPLVLTVERSGAALDLPSGLGPRPEEEVAVRLWVEPDTAYVGQQVTLTVGAFFAPTVRSRLQRQPEYRPPELQGFWTTDLPGSARPERRLVGRREYFVQTYRRALFPLSPGSFTIPPAAVIYEVRRGLIYAPETFQVESAPATVVIRPLPTDGVPPHFSGAVGRFTAQVWFDRSDLRAGEAVNLVFEVQGSGNLSSIARPPLPEIDGVRVYEGGEDAEVQLRGTEFAGYKRFYWVLVPERAGTYVLPEFSLPYFDPVEAGYSLAGTDPVSLTVSPAPLSASTEPAAGSAIRFVKTGPGRQPLDLHRHPLFWALTAAPVLLLLVVVTAGRLKGRLPSVGRIRSPRRRRSLRNLRPLAESGDAGFYGGLRSAVVTWLEARLHLRDLGKKGIISIEHELEDAGVPPPVAMQVIDLLEECGRLRYAPKPPPREKALRVLSAAETLLATVDREAVSERRLRSDGVGSTLVLLLTAGLLCHGAASPARGQTGATGESVQRWISEGVTAYGGGDYALALDRFERAAATRPRDPNLLYNLGNTQYELDRRGSAVANWIKTLRLTPRDGDARFNLRVAIGDDPVLGSALPPLPLSPDELAVLFMTFWVVGFVALAASRIWRKGYLTFVGLVAIVLAVVWMALLLLPRSDYAVVASAEASLRAGPVRQSEILYSPAPGTGFVVEEWHGDWVRVSRGADSEGWIEASHIELID